MVDTPASVAESLLAKAKHDAQARLRLYIGAAPGVGKSYKMLEDVHELKRQGVDAVIGFIEPHGRADTLALVANLELVPLREIAYRGVILREMDVELGAVAAARHRIAERGQRVLRIKSGAAAMGEVQGRHVASFLAVSICVQVFLQKQVVIPGRAQRGEGDPG